MAVVGSALFADSGLTAHFGLNGAKLVKFLAEVERGYVASNTYHNALHGLDVGQTMHFFLTEGVGLGNQCSWPEKLAALTAALVHDVGHRGLNNNWLIATDDPLAITYNYTSPLESMHASKVSRARLPWVTCSFCLFGC